MTQIEVSGLIVYRIQRKIYLFINKKKPSAMPAHFDIYIGVKVAVFYLFMMCLIILIAHHKLVILQAIGVSYYTDF